MFDFHSQLTRGSSLPRPAPDLAPGRDTCAGCADAPTGEAAGLTSWFGPQGEKLNTSAWQARGYDTAAIRNAAVWSFHTLPAATQFPNHTSILPFRAQLGRHFDELLSLGIVEQHCPAVHGEIQEFAAVINPLHVVPKPDSSLRPIIDPTCSGVNECMTQLPCELPDLYDLLHQLPPGGYLGKRDLTSGFYHIKLAPEARRFMVRSGWCPCPSLAACKWATYAGC